MGQEFAVRPTLNRRDSGGGYIIRMSAEATRRKFGAFRAAPKLVAITHTHFGIPDCTGIEICSLGWLHVGLEDRRRQRRATRGEVPEFVELDQTLRQALGLDYGDYSNLRIEVHPVERARGAGLRFAKIVGRRIVFCRPAVLEPIDIEKHIVRVGASVFGLLGIRPGERVQVGGIMKDQSGRYFYRSVATTALEADTHYIEQYRSHGGASVNARYPDVGKLIYAKETDPDLFPIFTDSDIRTALFGGGALQSKKWPDIPPPPDSGPYHEARFAQCIQPVVVFREPKSAVAKQIFALAGGSVAAGVAVYQFLRNTFPDLPEAIQYPAAGVIAFSAVALLVLIKTRNEVG